MCEKGREQMPVKWNSDLILGFTLLTINIFLYETASKIFGSAAHYPKAVLLFVIIFSVILTGQGAVALRRQMQTEKRIAVNFVGPSLVLGTTFIYVLFMNSFGFFVATTIFLPTLMIALKQKSRVVILATTAIFELLIYVIFVIQLHVRLP
jgi:hypothetical protein